MTLPLSSVVPIAQEVAKGNDSNTMASIVETDLLIVGTGPAGASLACFLASHGLKGIMIGSASGSAETPRAHIVNMAAQVMFSS
ncbi:MAG: 2,4-dichlorophenol 6-monooxygenase [Lasallia pustulata]|uniref:2,4-dichlorophenol 6-monooxygenase n=1 Tax=Lasallia pustulata TaxID=136370 RepID=A0A5M8PXB8_9LECA|nr:MAG: 2,4-dichlorophenol 6-monooxygenase [Lasallia pustulata]